MSGYFDHNATTPLHPAARDAWVEATERFWHNPSSLYREAAAVKERLEHARERLSELLGCEPGRVVFTSGATESNHAFFRAIGKLRASNLPGYRELDLRVGRQLDEHFDVSLVGRDLLHDRHAEFAGGGSSLKYFQREVSVRLTWQLR